MRSSVRCCSRLLRSDGRLVSVWATDDFCVSTSDIVAPPRSNWRSMSWRMRFLVAISVCVDSICARSDASWIAATTMFELRVTYAASSWKRWSCTCAAAALTLLAVPKKSSG